MPRKRKSKSKIKSVGRPNIKIDWERVEKLLRSGCSGVKIASSLGIHPETLYGKCEKENKMGFSVYSQQKKEKGDCELHEKQFDQALEGDTTLLIWFGKTRLDQKENPDVVLIAPAHQEQFKKLMNQFSSAQSLNMDTSNNKSA